MVIILLLSWSNERMIEWTNDRMKEWTNGWINEWTNEWISCWLYPNFCFFDYHDTLQVIEDNRPKERSKYEVNGIKYYHVI